MVTSHCENKVLYQAQQFSQRDTGAGGARMLQVPFLAEQLEFIRKLQKLRKLEDIVNLHRLVVKCSSTMNTCLHICCA